MGIRTILSAAFSLLPLLVLPSARAREDTPAERGHQSYIEVHAYDPIAAFTRFSLQFPGLENEADDSPVVHLQVNPTDDLSSSDVDLNGNKLEIVWEDSTTDSSQILILDDRFGHKHAFAVSWTGIVAPPPPAFFVDEYEQPTQNIHFKAIAIDGSGATSIGFAAIMRPNAPQRLVGIVPDFGSSVIRFREDDWTSSENHQSFSPLETSDVRDQDEVDLAAELEELILLEKQAEDLHDQIKAKKKLIKYQLKQEHDKLCIKHLIKECDGVICAAKVVAQRMCEKMGINLQPEAAQYAKIKSQHEITFNENGGFSTQSVNIPLILTKNSSIIAFKAYDLSDPPHQLLRVLGIIAAVLGLTALFAFVKRRCMSMRKRVERAADIEERRNARAYRRAARRALMRKRWSDFCNAINCFRKEAEARTEDYEEKRALILQDAFLEQDLDHAEKGEIMEAEIRELRYAHEIVSSLVRVDESRYNLVAPVHDPPPPLVRLPYTPATRSRASTYTLPSYTSESLPDYSSRPADDRSSRSNSLVEFTPPTSNTGSTRPIPSENSFRTRYTPTSSVIETSPRPSAETLRMRQSGESGLTY